MIRYSPRTARAIAVLFRRYNDCDVFVEDSTLVGVHERLINAALAQKGRVRKVIPLGPKDAVIEAARNDNNPDDRPRLYVVDGDFEAMFRRGARRISNLYTLKTYEIENVLLEDRQIEDALVSCFPNRTRDEVTQLIDMAGFWQEIVHLRPYLVALAIAQKLNLQDASNRLDPRSVARFEGQHVVGVDQARIRNRVFEISRALLTVFGVQRIRAEREAVLRNVGPNFDVRRFGPGRKILLYLINGRIARHGGNTVPHGTFCSIMGLTPSFALEPSYRRRIRKLL